MAFEAKDYAISDILNKSVFDIPRNQRRYVWKKPHWQDLYEDIVFSITETKPHFVGSIVLESGGKKDGLSYYTIIDGQQRLTTITIVLLAIMKHFHDFYERSSFTSARGIATRFREKPFDPSKRTEYLAKLMYNNILELNQFDYSKD